MGMVRLATVALLLVAAPVFAASVVTYELQLGGDNHAAAIQAGTRQAYTSGSATDNQTYPPGVLNWAANLAVSGNQDQPGHPSNGLPVQGVANFVINLELRSGSAAGPLVSNVSYYSSIHSGAGALTCADCAGGYTIPGGAPFCAGAAFTYIFNMYNLGWGPGTVLEALSSVGGYTGPYMEIGMYPTVDVGNTSGDGQVLGVGAGYGQWSRGGGFATLTSKGVGIPTASGGLGVLPLVEGQIDTSQLANGTYVLKLTPGAGHNVLRGDVDLVTPPAAGNPEVQAFAVPANQVVGDTITFVIGQSAVLAVTPNNQNIAAGGGSTSFTVSNAGPSTTLNYNATTSDSWLHITGGASGSCPPDATITVTVDPNGGPTQRVGTITVTAAGAQGSPKQVTVTQEGLVPIALVSAASVRTHGTAGQFGIPFFPTPNSECRPGGPTTLALTFNRPPVNSGGGAVTADDVMIYADSSAVTVTNAATNGSVLTLTITGVVSPDRLYLDLSGVYDTEGNMVGDVACLAVIHGDASNDRVTNTSDYVYVRGRIGAAVGTSNFRADVNVDGQINTSDYVSVRGRIGQSYGGC